MSQVEVDYRDCDRQIWEEELADFVPSRMLDAHIHCIWDSNYPEGPPDRKGRRTCVMGTTIWLR